MSKTNCIIDLTDLTISFTLADHCGLSNEVIELLDTDDSLCYETESNDSVPPSKTASVKNVKPKKRLTAAGIKNKIRKQKSCLSEQTKIDEASPKSEKKTGFRRCPICWEEIGVNPLASTKCGHVYCLECITQYLKFQRKCPTCRGSLKGSNAYHPLYFE